MLVDLFDVGARYYTFIWTLYLCMKPQKKPASRWSVADRPNPINGVTCEGEVLDPNYRSFVGLHPIQVRHAMTIGELAQNVPARGLPRLPVCTSSRSMVGSENSGTTNTGLRWVMPSPNSRPWTPPPSIPACALFEATNLSEGRGTTRPFELFGAPFIDSENSLATS